MASQQQDVTGLSRDAAHANQTLSPIFDKEKEQNRLATAQKIGEIGRQVSDVLVTQGKLNAQAAQSDPAARAAARAKLVAGGNGSPSEEQINAQVSRTATADYDTGGKYQKVAQAVTAAMQGLAGGNLAQAASGAVSPYVAEIIHRQTPDCDTDCKGKLAEDVAEGNAVVSAHLADTVGLGILPKGALVTAAISGGANTAIQYATTSEVNYIDALIATWVGAATSKTGWLGTVGWNAAGGAISSYLKGDNPFTGGLSNGLASGVGYGAGKLIELPMDKIYNPMKPWKDWIWTDVGMGISKPLPINPVPGIAGNASGSAVTEILNDQAGKTSVKFQKGNQK